GLVGSYIFITDRVELAVAGREALPELARAVAAAGARLYRLEPRGESLEEFFLHALEEARP
ncbi:MAG: hypothetical protein IRZ26_03540, partial [Clostridia bacterium]|nr:hypothetical protein [Clostridia bacterium]